MINLREMGLNQALDVSSQGTQEGPMVKGTVREIRNQVRNEVYLTKYS